MNLTRRIMPSAALQPYVAYYWFFKADYSSVSMNILPTGCSKWMFYRGKSMIVDGVGGNCETATVCGLYLNSISVCVNESTDSFFVVFKPYAMRLILGIPTDEFFMRNVEMSEIGIAELDDLKWRVFEAQTDEEAVELVETFLLRRLAAVNDFSHARRISAACQAIDGHPDINVGSLSDTACLCQRQFRRVFTDYVGASPKQILRMRRFLLAAKELQRFSCDAHVSEIAARLGYTDHSHFYHEFHQITGMSPTEYVMHISQLRRCELIKGYNSYHGE
ncbi:MAG: helix-turn-helix domain-containing protein [Candidatus Limisoma sp.]